MKSDWAIDFLKMHHKFEDNSEIKTTIASIISAYDNKDEAIVSNLLSNAYASIDF